MKDNFINKNYKEEEEEYKKLEILENYSAKISYEFLKLRELNYKY